MQTTMRVGSEHRPMHGVRPGAGNHQLPATKPAPRATPRSKAALTGVPTLPESDVTELGKSGLKVPVMGVGAWAWGDRSGYWGYGREYGKEASQEAFKAILDSGLTFIDTAEVYGFGKSEEFLGEFIKAAGEQGKGVQVATKFAPLPWRQTPGSVPAALKASLARLQLDRVSLYMIHWPGFFLNAFSNDAFVEGLVQVKQQGLAEAVGVSNFRSDRVRDVSRRLARDGLSLASNQVQYSLLYRAPETNGVFEACRENGVTLVAYSPLAQGLLTGKYKADGSNRPSGPRGAVFSDSRLQSVQPVLAAVKAVADERGKTMAQVALNWIVCKGALPIPGVKNAKQMAEVAGAVGWRLSDAEIAELDAASSRVKPALGTGAPFENW